MQLQIEKLSKTYKNGVRAMDQLNFTIGKGMFGLLGPNGAGKSTLMRTIATLQRPDSGKLFFNGIDLLANPMELRKVLGYLPQEFGVYKKGSAVELLDLFAQLKGIHAKKDRQKIIDEVLEITNLTHDRKKRVSRFSGGMKQRFGIAQLLLNRPQLIIVDEPTAGLDPAERVRFLNVLREVGTENTVIFSTHIVEDVQDLCHELGIMGNGKLLTQTTPAAGMAELKGKIWGHSINREELEKMENSYTVLSSSFNPDNSLSIRVLEDQAPTPGFHAIDPVLEDVYFAALRKIA